MTDQHPLTPPLSLVEELQDLGNLDAIRLAYQAGADYEFEASCKWFREFYKGETWMLRDLKTLRASRRPKPPSLKEQALESLHHLEAGCEPNIDLLRRALEALPND